MNNLFNSPLFRFIRAAVSTRGPPSEYSAKIPSPQEIRRAFEADRQKLGQVTIKENGFKIRSTMIPAIEHGIAPSIETLKSITLKEIAQRVNYIHENRVLFATTVCDPSRIVGTSFLVEDSNGDCLKASLYNFVRDDENPKDILPCGTHLAFLAPYMRNAGDSRDRELLLRCDNPQCIWIYDWDAEWLAAKEGKPPPIETEDPSELLRKGNEAFQRGLVRQAMSFYSRALNNPSISHEDMIACLSNRAEVYLRKEQWEYAETDCKAVLDLEDNHMKAKFHLSKALLRLGHSERALDVINVYLAQNAKDRSFKSTQQEAERLLREENGHYDLEPMRYKQTSSGFPKFHADYASKSVAFGVDVLKADGKMYRGCIATDDIASNKLICASKAFAFVQSKGEDDIPLQFNPHSNMLEVDSDGALTSAIVNKLYRRPMLGRLLYKLHSENEFTDQADPEKINIGRIRSIKSCNSFGAASTNSEATLNWEIIQKKAKCKAARMMNDAKELEVVDRMRYGTGLWIRESMFNHSCTPNCTWSQIGDHIFIRTARPIKKNEELCITYVSHDKSYRERKEIFEKWIRPGLGFSCACEWCCLLRANPSLRKMENEVDTAFKEAVILMNVHQFPMASAAEMVMSDHRREEILEAFKHFPLHLQNRPIQRLWVFQGVILNSRGDFQASYECFKMAAAIGFAVYGEIYEYCKDLWRLVGSAMRCEMKAIAREQLLKIWNMDSFQSLDTNAQQIFSDLTIYYAAPFWNSVYDPLIDLQLKALVDRVCQTKNTREQSPLNDKARHGKPGTHPRRRAR